jgi:hypothetical protein
MISKDDSERGASESQLKVVEIGVPEIAVKRNGMLSRRRKVRVLSEARGWQNQFRRKAQHEKLSLRAFPSMHNNLDCKFIHEKIESFRE